MLAKGAIFGAAVPDDYRSAQLGPGASPGTWELLLEGKKCGLVFRDECEASLGLTLAHSVLNMKFSRKNKNFCMFVQKHVLDIDDGVKVPSPVLSFVQSII